MKEVSWVVGFPLEMLDNAGIGTEEADVGVEPGLRLAVMPAMGAREKRWSGIR